MYGTFEELFAAQKSSGPKRLVVACADEEHTLQAVSMAAQEGAVIPILVGPEDRLSQCRLPGLEKAVIVHADGEQDAVNKAVAMCRRGEGDILLKGLVETAVILRAVVNKETGLCAQGVLSHLTLAQIPNYRKLLGVTDCALLTYPNLEQKKAAITNAVRFLNSLGTDPVKVAVLAAIEKVNPKMPETVDADLLKQWWAAGEAEGCIIEGPMSYDLAMRPGAAKVKHFDSRVAGEPDLLAVPNITVGNVLIKSLTCSAGAVSAGLILGATVPIVVTSRSSTVATKAASIRLAAAM